VLAILHPWMAVLAQAAEMVVLPSLETAQHPL
jgi:hypothetical protein